MYAPWRTALCTASCLVWLLVWCGAGVLVQVHSLPCETPSSVQLPMIVCFITASNEHYDYESLRTGLCSHIVLIDLIGVGKDGSLELLQTSSRSLDRFSKLRQHFSDVGDEARFIISIGGVAQKSSHFSNALKTTESRFALSDELISFIIKHELGGLDIAWFYPAQFGGAESDRTNLIVFLRDLYLRTKACGISLSLTVGVDPKDIEVSYDVPRINEVVDFVNLLTGDYHNPTSPTHISPLYGQGPRDRLNINYSVMSYIEAGLNPRKIVIMGSCYAYLYVSKICKNETFTSTKLRTVMRLSYLSANELITRESLRTSWDDMRHVPYGMLTKGITKKWLTYNDVESMRRKADYAQHHQLGGMGLFSVDEDDYGGRAGFGRYPMLRAVVSVLFPELDCSEEEAEEEIETIVCPHTGYMTDPVEPECYYTCEEGIPLHECPKKCCPQGQIFNEDRNTCYQSPGMMQMPFRSDLMYHPMEQPFAYQLPYQNHPPTGYQATGDHYMDKSEFQPPAEHLRMTPNHSPMFMTDPQMPQLTVRQNDPIMHTNAPMPAQDHIPIIEASSPISNPSQQCSMDVLPTLLGSPSTIAPMYASADEPEHQASNLVPQVVVIPNADEGHIPQGSTATTTEAVEILNTPCALKSELEEATDPPVVITPKPSRSTRREKDRRRKSRSKSHSTRTTSTEMPTEETTLITTPERSTETDLASVGTARVTTTTTTEPPQPREMITETTQPPPRTEATEPRTVSFPTASSTSSIATTTSSTTTSSMVTTTTTTVSTATTPNVTFSDKTSPIVTSPATSTTAISPVPTALSNTRIATATTPSTAIANTTLHDAPLPLETTIT